MELKLRETYKGLEAKNYDKLIFSGGKIGYQVETTLDELKKVINFDLKDIT